MLLSTCAATWSRAAEMVQSSPLVNGIREITFGAIDHGPASRRGDLISWRRASYNIEPRQHQLR